MDYKLEDLIDIPFFQDLLDKLNEISPFPSAIIDIEGKILTATAWQPICTKFHRINPQSEKECLVSDQYILEHINEANPAVSYRCPHGMIDNAIPIIIGGKHLANFFTGQFFLERPNLEFFRKQAVKYGFDETSYLEAVQKTPVWSKYQLKKYIEFIHPFVHSMADMGLTRLQDLENKKILEDSELRYRDLFETAPVMYVIAHDVNGLPVITDCNQKFLDALGYKRIEVLGKELTDLYTADSKIEFLQKGGYQRITSGGSLAEERDLVCKNESLLNCLVWARPEIDPGGNVTGLRAAYMDISHRKETEQALQDSELRYAATIDALGDGIHVVDENLTVQLCNASMSKWMQELGYSSILAGKNLFQAIPFLPERVREEYQQVFRSRKTIITEDISQAGGREIQTETRKIPVIENGKVVRVVTIVRDITEQKRSEAERRKADSMLHTVLENAPITIFATDKQGVFTLSEGKGLENVGLKPGENVGVSAFDLFGSIPFVEENGEKFTGKDVLERVLAGETVTAFNVLNGVNFDNHISPIHDGDGEVVGVVGVATDITRRKQAERELHETLRNTQAILDATMDSVLLIETDGKIVAANFALAQFFGYSTEELVGKNAYDFFDKDLVKIRRRNAAEVITGGKPVFYEDESSGRVITYAIYPMLDDGGNVVRLAIFGKDISERKHADQQLKLSESELKKAQSYAHVGSWIWDIKSGHLQWSDEIYTIFGISRENFNGKLEEVVARAIHPDDREKVERSNLSVMNEGKPIPLEYRILHPDGSERVVWAEAGELERDEIGNPCVLRGIVMDITERKLTENELKESETRFRSIIEASPVPYALNDEQQNITYLNRAFVNTYGYTLGDIPTLEEWWPKAYPEEEYRQWVASTWQEHLDSAKKTNSPFEPIELNIHCKDGSYRTALVGAAALGEALKGVHLVILYDITERKQAEKLLETERNFATQVMNSMGQGLTVTDEQGCFEYVNSAYAAITGYKPNDLLGKRPDEITSPDDICILEAASNQRKNGETTTYETRLLHKDGHKVPVMITGVPRWRDGKVCGTIAVITDLTERNLVEGTLRESEAQYRQRVNELQTIMDTIPVVLWVAHDSMCKVIKGNRAAYELHKLPMDSNASFTSPEGQQIIHSRVFHNGVQIAGSDLPLQVSASKGIEISDYEEEVVFDDGRVLYEIGNAKPLFDETGKPRGAVGAFINITERKQAENEVSKRAKELDALQKIVLDITASQNIPGLLESIVASACQLVGAPCGAMYLSEPKKQEVNCVVSYNTNSDYTGTILKFGEGVAGKIAQTGQSMNIPNYQIWAGRSQIFEQEKPFTAILGVPLMWGGQVSGVIDLMHFEKESSFNQEDMEVLNLFAGHAAIAIENTRLLQEAISHNDEVRQLSIRLEEAEENERRRIARELHDQVGQSLSALSINLNIVHSQMPEYLPGFKRRLEDSLMLIDQTTDNIRSLMSELRPAVLDDYGLKAALDWAATAIARRTELKVEVVGECKRFEPRVEIALFRIAQEALSNVTRHAQAKNVKVQLEQNGSDLIMSITDDGIGMGTTLSLESKTGGMGLRLMRERAEAIGGSLQIESSHVLGTKITVKYHDQDPAGR